MKSLFISLLFLFGLNRSQAQSVIPDTSTIVIRRGPCIYYIDGIKVNSCDSIKDSTARQEIQIITGGLPGTYGDMNSSLIKVTTTSPTEIDRKQIKKEQKIETE